MPYTAYVREIERYGDEIRIKIEYTNGTESYEKTYPFVSATDINNTFRQTILAEVSRINTLVNSVETLKTNWLDKEVT
jgi:hypothetical protein